MKENRQCAYCGKDDRCRCAYKYMRAGASAFSMHNTARQTTFGEMKREFLERTKNIDPNIPGAWIFSFTEFDQEKIARSDSKRKPEASHASL